MKCCVFVRFVYELIYLDSFIEHYVNLGFDKIIVLYHDLIPAEIPENYKNYVEIHDVPNLGNKLPNEYKHVIPKDIDWVLHVDSDEYLLIHHKYSKIQDFINEKLLVHPEINIFLFPWAWLHKFDNENKPLNDIFKKYKMTVGNRLTSNSNKNEIWIKSMFRRSHLDTFYIHCPSMLYGYYLYCNELIIEEENENKIKSLYYKNKHDEIYFYKDVILAHLATRSLQNAIFKSEHMHKSQVSKKNINDKDGLLEYVTSRNIVNEDEYTLMKTLKEYVGYKIEWPLKCLKMNEIDVDIENYLRDSKVDLMSDYYENYNKLFEDSITNNNNLKIALNKIINRFNIIFLK